MFIDPECNTKRTIVDEVQDGFLRIGVTRQQVHRLREHWLANEERRVEFLYTVGNPIVVSLRPVEEGDERSGINDGGGHCGRSLQDAWDWRRGRGHRNR